MSKLVKNTAIAKRKKRTTFDVTHINKSKSVENEDHFDKSIRIAMNMWDDLRRRVKENPSYATLSDKEKVSIYHDGEFKDFYIEFPIVSRYMITLGQFSLKAFRRFLKKCKDFKPDPSKRLQKGYSEDQWVQRRADYIRYLWESYQPPHFSKDESNKIWQNTYKALTKEFSDFRKMHDDIEKKLKENDGTNKKKLSAEFLERIKNGDQNLDEESTKDLIEVLRKKVEHKKLTEVKNNKEKVLNSIRDDVKYIKPSRVSYGCAK